jgi:hypothetical protein
VCTRVSFTSEDWSLVEMGLPFQCTVCKAAAARPTKGIHTSFVYFEEIKRELKRTPIYECRRNERLKAKAEGSRRLTYTGLNT